MEAESLTRRAVESRTKAERGVGYTGQALAGLARVFAATGRPVEAERHCQRALAVQEHNYATDSAFVDVRRDLARTRDAYSAFLRTRGRTAEAAPLALQSTTLHNSLRPVTAP